ncbi:nuclear transport factor 2 family protein [Paraburkholderia susongensis]|uniref:SnoaL-like domain-containing protein n=1 Tax=Paraburkholderia susongensis TaxID=1515439 RepID=A0A1X7L6W9_9BURK|nr:nuclear transport factor 2 family protein [Paraburkholderia susongensis]SMG48982.1 SnoaL-like domain-containing protein [Paraburkholderia susongensis]
MTISIQRSDHDGLTPQEIGDRLAIRELVDAYAHCADRRDVEGQMSLFTADTEFLVFMDSRSAVPTQEIRGREGLRPVFENLGTYEATTHFNGQSTVTWSQDSATGVSYCLAHHVKVDDAGRSLMIASIRYLDHFVKMDGHWYFRQRKLMVDWIDNRPLSAG